MLESVTTPELRRQLHAEHATRLRLAVRPASPGPLRVALGSVLVRVGERLGGERGVRLQPDPWVPVHESRPWGQAEA